ncbi:MAG TPA: hypothetical protein PKD51_01210 [Saprospiraceae bacterium]|nr:hypothetical protein [Saprospiraceae bacterium]
MNSVIHIKTNPSLSPKHIEFNKLVKSIEKLRTELTNEEKKLEIFSDYYIKNIIPIKEDHCKVQLEMAILLDELSEGSKLPKNTINELESIIPELLSDSFQHLPPDEKAKAVFEKWTAANYDDIVKEAKEEQLDEMTEFMKSMGIDLDFTDLDMDDPESAGKFYEKVHEAKQKYESENEERKTSKKKTKKQLEAEELAKMQDELKNKNLRSVYLSLAKILHPDSETDPELKLEKEEVMKQVTKAYEDKDIITMLVIETQWLKNTEERLANIKEDVAAIYIQLLKEQAKKLRQQKAELRYHPRFQHVNTYLRDKVDIGILRMSAQKEYIERDIRNTKKEIDIIKSSPRSDVKKFIKKLAQKYYKDPMDDFINFFSSNRF